MRPKGLQLQEESLGEILADKVFNRKASWKQD